MVTRCCHGNQLFLFCVLQCVAYGLGLSLAFVALFVTDSAQPALLYIVPCLLFGLLFTAAFRGHLALFLHIKKAEKRKEMVSYDVLRERKTNGNCKFECLSN